MNLIGWPRFFIGVVMGFVIGGTADLAIGGAVLIEINIAVGFFGLFLW